MSRYLAVDAEQGHLYLASATVKGHIVEIEKAINLPEIGVLTAANAAALGRRLKEALKEAGIQPAPVLVSVGRERVVLKEIKYPASVTAAEEPALVRFQMSKELAEGGDSVVIDYFTLPTPDPDGQRRALAFAIRKEFLVPLKTVCAEAGLKLAGITPRPFGIAASLMRAIKDGAVTAPESPLAPVAILVRGDTWGELVIVRGGQLAFSRSLTGMALNSEQAMLGEIRRNLAVFAGQSGQNAVQTLYVAEGDVPGGWAGRARAGLTIPVQSYDPIAGIASTVPPEHHGCFTGAIGLISTRTRSTELPINFLQPRQPKSQSDPGKRLIAYVAAAAGVLLVAGLGFGLFLEAQKQKERTALQIQKNQIEEDIRNLDDISKRVAGVHEWESKGLNWLDELYDLTARFPDPSGTEVKQMIFQYVDPPKNSKLKHVAEMQLTLGTDSV
ncbi:MAG: hypothetical protein K8T89_03435, partial [Planctomycetes bacterium]|nr:hypothetical protein [Planctomycetota bacterium]